jgi:GNAT superfamily N-acetyltransferase
MAAHQRLPYYVLARQITIDYDHPMSPANPVTLRPATTADVTFLREMLYHAIYTPPGGPPLATQILQRTELSRYVDGWVKPGDMGVIAELSGIPVGAAWLRLMKGENRGYGYVEDGIPELTIALLPDYRSMGIGTQLLTHLLGRAAGHYPAVSLSVSADNPACRLYQRHGFVVIRDDTGSLTMLFRFDASQKSPLINSA